MTFIVMEPCVRFFLPGFFWAAVRMIHVLLWRYSPRNFIIVGSRLAEQFWSSERQARQLFKDNKYISGNFRHQVIPSAIIGEIMGCYNFDDVVYVYIDLVYTSVAYLANKYTADFLFRTKCVAKFTTDIRNDTQNFQFLSWNLCSS